MSSDHWNKLMDSLQRYYAFPGRYQALIEEYMELIPLLRNHKAFALIIPGLSHLTLTFKIPEKPAFMTNAYYDGEGIYQVNTEDFRKSHFAPKVISNFAVHRDALPVALVEELDRVRALPS